MRIETVDDFMNMCIEPSNVQVALYDFNGDYEEPLFEGWYGDIPKHFKTADVDSWSLYKNVITLNVVL